MGRGDGRKCGDQWKSRNFRATVALLDSSTRNGDVQVNQQFSDRRSASITPISAPRSSARMGEPTACSLFRMSVTCSKPFLPQRHDGRELELSLLGTIFTKLPHVKQSIVGRIVSPGDLYCSMPCKDAIARILFMAVDFVHGR